MTRSTTESTLSVVHMRAETITRAQAERRWCHYRVSLALPLALRVCLHRVIVRSTPPYE